MKKAKFKEVSIEEFNKIMWKSKIPLITKDGEGRCAAIIPRDGCPFDFDTKQEAVDFVTGGEGEVFFEG